MHYETRHFLSSRNECGTKHKHSENDITVRLKRKTCANFKHSENEITVRLKRKTCANFKHGENEITVRLKRKTCAKNFNHGHFSPTLPSGFSHVAFCTKYRCSLPLLYSKNEF